MGVTQSSTKMKTHGGTIGGTKMETVEETQAEPRR